MTGPIKLCFAFGIENMAGQDGKERESAKLEPLGLQIESSLYIEGTVNFLKREPPRSLGLG